MTKIYDFRTVSAKLPQDEASAFLEHCNKKGVSQSEEIRSLIKSSVKEPLPVNMAGKSVFVYNPARDNFSWRAILDKGLISYIDDNLSPAFLQQLKEAIDKAIEERDTFLQKKGDDSVAMPSKILRKGL